MRTKKFLIGAAGAAMLLALAGCSASPVLDGQWGDPDAEGQPSLEFHSEDADKTGTYNGTDGCNVVRGDFVTEDDGVIDLGAMISTMMFCEGVDDWLTQSRTAEFDGANTLRFFDENGEEIGSLERNEASGAY